MHYYNNRSMASAAIVIVALAAITSISYSKPSQEQEQLNPIADLINNQLKKTVVFIGKIDTVRIISVDINAHKVDTIIREEPNYYATGVLVGVQNIFHLITAKHVVVEKKDGVFTNKLSDDGLYIFFNSTKEVIAKRSIGWIKKEIGVNWIFHENSEVDIAIIPIVRDREKDDVKIIQNSLFLESEGIFELDDVFFLSYQPGIKYFRKITPIIRKGMISLKRKDKSFYIDGFAFPGNSGSPVFTKPSPMTLTMEGVSVGDQRGLKFIGIVGEYIPYIEPAISPKTGQIRIVFEENTGLSKVWSVDFVNEIIESDSFKNQIKKLLKKIGK